MSRLDAAKSSAATFLSRPILGYFAAAVFVLLSAFRDVQIGEQDQPVPVSLTLSATFLIPVLIGCAFQFLPVFARDASASPYAEQNFRATVILNISTLIGWFATVSSLQKLSPPIVAAIATGFLPVSTTIIDICTRSRHRLTLRDLYGSLLVLAGVALLVFSGSDYDSVAWLPLVFALLIPIAGAVSNVQVRKLNEMTVSTRAVYSSRFWALILVAFVAGFFEDLHILTESGVLWNLVWLGLVGISVPLYLIQVAVQRLGAQRAASMTGLTAVAAFLLSQSSDLGTVQPWLGALLVPAGIYLAAAIPTAVVVDAFSSGFMLAPELTRRGFRCIHVQSTRDPNPYYAAGQETNYFSHHIIAEDRNPYDIPPFLKTKGVQVVVAGTESGVNLADHLSETLGLPTNGSQLSEARRDKFKMITVLREFGLVVTEHHKTHNVDEAKEWAGKRFDKGQSVVVKPLSSAAADNVYLCSTITEVVAAFEAVLGASDFFGSRNVDVLLERYLPGGEYVVNTVSHDGSHFVTDIWRKSSRRIHGTSLVNEYDDLMPSQGPVQQQLGEYVRQALDALEIKYGPAHAELKMTPEDGPALIEIAARLVGAHLPVMCEVCTDNNPVSLVVDAYMNGSEFRRKTRAAYQMLLHGRVVFLISSSSGEWSPAAKEALRRRLEDLPSFRDAVLSPDDRVKPTMDLASCPGVVFLAASTEAELVRDYGAIRAMEAESVYGTESGDVDRFGEFDAENRGKQFSHAVAECPAARENEVSKMLQLLEAKERERLVDFGAGNGLLTGRIASGVGNHGEVVAIDSSMTAMKMLQENLGGVAQIERRLWRHESLPLPTGTVDGIASLANLHHVKYKEKLFCEFARVLAPAGRLVVGDVAANTAVQRYFDGPVDKYCSTGHKHPFLDEPATRRLCDQAGLHMESWSMADVPWRFSSRREMMSFIHRIHDVQCSPEEFLGYAKEFLGYERREGAFLLNWQLFFMVARRRR